MKSSMNGYEHCERKAHEAHRMRLTQWIDEKRVPHKAATDFCSSLTEAF